MKILIRNYGDKQYVWETAKYKRNGFCVNDIQIRENEIVSIVNDNRKNYVQCSCCGEIFRRGDHHKFQEHKANAVSSTTCFGCPHLCIDGLYTIDKKYIVDDDGSFVETLKRRVDLKCNQTGGWTYASIDSQRAIDSCKRRQCASAGEVEIVDFFTMYPGAFDEIITIDTLLDLGCNAKIPHKYDTAFDFVFEDRYTIQATVNLLGVIDSFNVYCEGDWYTLYYSKKYDTLFRERRGKYEKWNPFLTKSETKNEIKEHIAKLYR